MSSFYSSNIEQVNTKLEALKLIYDPTRLLCLIYSKYGDIEEDFNSLHANQLIYNLPTKLNCIFKEMKYSIYERDFLKRQYKLIEATSRIPRLSDYYKNYHLFFCRPILRHYKLNKLISKYQDKKAEIFYKNNYHESKNKNSIEKDENIKKSSLSFSSLDNITNNKIIFDKHTKKILDKSETDIINNNYYNTLILDSSRSNLLVNNGLISKRSGGENSFENCINALLNYQFNKNKSKINKNNRKNLLKNKKYKSIKISTSNSNKFSKPKNSLSQSQKQKQKINNFKLYDTGTKNINNKKIRISGSSNSKSLKYINEVKFKSKSLYNLSKNRYNTSSSTLLHNKNINLNKKMSHKKEFSLIFPITTTNKSSKKNTLYIYSNNNSNTINTTGLHNKYHSNTIATIFSKSITINTSPKQNNEKIKNVRQMNNKYKNFPKITEYLKNSQNKDNNCNNSNNLIQKFSYKNCLSENESDNKNKVVGLDNKNRITKKKITINKNLRITLVKEEHNNLYNISEPKPKHVKNKTFDFNIINKTSNIIKKNNNNRIIINNEDYNNSLNKKPKKNVCKINTDNNNFQSDKTNLTQFNKISENKKILISSTKNLINKIFVNQNTLNEKNNKKDSTVKIYSPNDRKKDFDYNKEINSPYHKKYNNSIFTKEKNPFDKYNDRENLIKSNKIKNINYCLSPNIYIGNKNNLISKNISSNKSPSNQLSDIIYLKRNINNNSNDIYQKKYINKNSNKIINKKRENNILQNNYDINNTTKDLYQNTSLGNNYNNIILYNSAINNHINSEYKKISRNKKKYTNKKFNNFKRINNNKTNLMSSQNKNSYNYYIENDIHLKNNLKKNKGNINISIENNNINIKNSILNIEEIYINKDSNIRNIKNGKITRVYSDVDYFTSQNKNTIDIRHSKINRVKIIGNQIKNKKDKNISMNYSPLKLNLSPKIINVHRNINLIDKKK